MKKEALDIQTSSEKSLPTLNGHPSQYFIFNIFGEHYDTNQISSQVGGGLFSVVINLYYLLGG